MYADRFRLDLKYVSKLTHEFMDQLDRCHSDTERRIILGVKDVEQDDEWGHHLRGRPGEVLQHADRKSRVQTPRVVDVAEAEEKVLHMLALASPRKRHV
jgi:hypothetical protein